MKPRACRSGFVSACRLSFRVGRRAPETTGICSRGDLEVGVAVIFGGGYSPACMLTGTVLVPCGVVERVERDLEVAAPIIFRYRKPPPCDVDLQGGQDQLRHWQGPVAVRAELHETCLVLAIHMGIFRLLLSNGAFPRWGSAAGLV